MKGSEALKRKLSNVKKGKWVKGIKAKWSEVL
jgi:hypothetical protein